MALQPLVRSCWGVCAARSDGSPARQRLPLVTVDCAGEALTSGNGKAHLVFYPEACVPAQVSGTTFVALQILCDYHTLRNGPAISGVEFRKYSCTNGNAAEYTNRKEKSGDTTQKLSTPPI